MSEAVVHSPFGPRKLRAPADAPPVSADSSSLVTPSNNNTQGQQLFGERKTRLPPAPIEPASTTTGPAQQLFGERKTRQPPPGDASPPPSAAANGGSVEQQGAASPFGPRLVRGASGIGTNAPNTTTGPPGSGSSLSQAASPFGATLRSRPPADSASLPQAQATLSSPQAFGVRPTTSMRLADGVASPAAIAVHSSSSLIDLPGGSGRRVPLTTLETIEGCLLHRRAVLHVRSRRVLAAIASIQHDYRSFLLRSGSSNDRRERRARHLQALRRLQEKLDVVGLQAREHGTAIAEEEATEWFLLLRSSMALRGRSVTLFEQEARMRIAAEAAEEFQSLFMLPNVNVPSFVRPGIERDEWVARAHTLQYEAFERVRLAAKEVAERGAQTIMDEQDRRRGIMDDQHSRFVSLLRLSRVDYWDAAVQEECRIEDRFRHVLEQQRLRFMSLLSRQAAAALALSFLTAGEDSAEGGGADSGGAYTESGYRRRIEEKAFYFWERMLSAFYEQRHFIGMTTVQREEHAGRCGVRSGSGASIEVLERRERQAIQLAMLRGSLMYMQGFTPTTTPEDHHRATPRLGDRHSESGSRASIMFAEDRERRALEHTLNVDAVQVFLPAIEQRQRQRWVDSERNELRGIIRVIGVVPLLFCLQEEPVPRRRIFEAWESDTIRHIFEFARIRLMDLEVRRRVHAYQQQELFHERLMALSYLARVEVTERRLIRKAIKSLNRRALQGYFPGHHALVAWEPPSIIAASLEHKPPHPLLLDNRDTGTPRYPNALSIQSSQARGGSSSPGGGGWRSHSAARHDAASSPIHSWLHDEHEAFRGTPFFDRVRRESSWHQPHQTPKSLDALLQVHDQSHPTSYQPSQAGSVIVRAPHIEATEGSPRGVSSSLLNEARSRYNAIMATRMAEKGAAVQQVDVLPTPSPKKERRHSTTRHRGPHDAKLKGKEGVISDTSPSPDYRHSKRHQLVLMEPPSPSEAALLSTSRSHSHLPANFQQQPQLDVDEMLDGTTWTEWLRGPPPSNKPAENPVAPATNSNSGPYRTSGSPSRRGSNAFLAHLSPELQQRLSPPRAPASPSPVHYRGNQHNTRQSPRQVVTRRSDVDVIKSHPFGESDDGDRHVARMSYIITPALHVAATSAAEAARR